MKAIQLRYGVNIRQLSGLHLNCAPRIYRIVVVLEPSSIRAFSLARSRRHYSPGRLHGFKIMELHLTSVIFQFFCRTGTLPTSILFSV